MSDPKTPLEPGNFYHIYNRGINRCSIFREKTNYEYFLSLYDKYISPVADTYAWVLMGNHFHLLVKILPVEDSSFRPATAQNPEGLGDLRGFWDKRINQQFSNLFNAYSKAYNKRYDRTGSLFEHSFRRKLITGTDYLKQLVLYIHNNPVRHGFCAHPSEYPWSSYLSSVPVKSAYLNRETVVGWFDNEANFKWMHSQKLEYRPIEEWLEI